MAKGLTPRTNLIRKAKTLQKRVLCMDDGVYKDMLLTRYAKDSTAKLDHSELKDLATHLDILAGNNRHSAMPDAQARKIWMLWLELHKIGAVRDKSERALNSFIKSRCRIKVESYRWLNTNQASTVIEQLKQWLMRVERKTAKA